MDRRKISTCQAFTKVNREDKPAPCKLTDAIKTNFNDRVDEIDRLWGCSQLQARIANLEKVKARDLAQRVGYFILIIQH